jgi:hypothetical protein
MSERITSATVAETLQNENVLDMFNSVLGGTGGQNWALHIIYPKMSSLSAAIDRFLKVLEVLGGAGPLDAFDRARGETGAYARNLRSQLAQLPPAPDIGRFAPASRLRLALEAGDATVFDGVPAAETRRFGAAFTALKRSNPVNVALVTCSNLRQLSGALGDAKNLKDAFLRQTPTIAFAPLLGLPALDFRLLYNSSLVDEVGRKVLLHALHKLRAIGHQIYELVTSPDVDVGEFVKTVMASIDDLRGKIPRCDAAFDKIKDSIELFRGRFGNYHKDYIISGKTSIIMENFVLDVAKETKNSPKVALQFRTIINHYKREAAGQGGQDPKLRAVFKAIDANLREAGAESKGADAGAEPGAPGAEPGTPGAEPGTPGAGPRGATGPAAADAKRGPSAKTARSRRRKARARERGRGLADPGGADPLSPARSGSETDLDGAARSGSEAELSAAALGPEAALGEAAQSGPGAGPAGAGAELGGAALPGLEAEPLGGARSAPEAAPGGAGPGLEAVPGPPARGPPRGGRACAA